METGTLNHEGIVGAGAAVDYLASLSQAGAPRRERLRQVSRELHARGAELLARLWQGLASLPGVTLYGPPPASARTATLSSRSPATKCRGSPRHLAGRGVFVSHGDFYATTVARIYGRERDGFVRAGCAAYTTSEEVERLLAGVRELAA